MPHGRNFKRRSTPSKHGQFGPNQGRDRNLVTNQARFRIARRRAKNKPSVNDSAPDPSPELGERKRSLNPFGVIGDARERSK